MVSIPTLYSFISLKLNSVTLFILCAITLSVTALELDNKLINFINKRFGAEAVQRLHQWEKIANIDKSIAETNKLKLVNTFFNQAEFISDIKHWGKEDYWATPIELLATNAGDCEDYSIAKYFTLREMGVAMDKIKITYVKAVKLNQAHMVLAYYSKPGAEPLILDNLILPKHSKLFSSFSFTKLLSFKYRNFILYLIRYLLFFL